MRPLCFFQSGGHHCHVLRKNIVRRAVQLRFELFLGIADELKKCVVIPQNSQKTIVSHLADAARYASNYGSDFIFELMYFIFELGNIKRQLNA